MPDLIWNGSLCAQTVFFDDFEGEDLEPLEGPAPADTQLTSSASWEVDYLTWHQTVSEAVTNEELRDLSYCSGTPVNAFMNGEFGGVKKYAEWLGKPEAQVIGKHRRHELTLFCAPCSAHFGVPPRAAYLESAQELDANGCAFFASPLGFPEALDRLLYQEWEQHEEANGYTLKHEALFTTLDNVNRRNGESLNIPVQFSDQAAFLTHASAPCEQSITAFAFSTHATQSANGRSKPSSGSKEKAPRKASAARSFKVFHATDTAWKGVWQKVMNASKDKQEAATADYRRDR